MDNSKVQLVGGPCGQHGPYTFYKAFKYAKNGIKRIVTLSEFFFVKLWIDSELLCIGELQLLWSDKNSDQVLASLRLYFLPENTPEGRKNHGEDEVLAIAEKVVLRVEDLITWITVDAEWTWGRLAKYEKDVREPPASEEGRNNLGSLTESSLDFSDVEKERKASDCHQDSGGPPVVILSYPRYCRYRAMMRRLEGVENEYLKYKIVNALGGFTASMKNTRILFCKETFDYPELEGHELLCNHLAPKLKGRPRGRRKKRSVSPGSESNESESSMSNVFNSSKEKIIDEGSKNGLRCDSSSQLRRSTRATENSESKEFLKDLTVFMKTNYTPIGKIPSLGYKELDLYSFYSKVQKLGGYDAVTTNRLWKSIFDDMSGHANSTSAATVIRRHYERFLLPYERHIKGEEYKPLPVSERRRLKSKTGGSSTSDAETSESTSRSGNSTPVPTTTSSAPPTPTTPTEAKTTPLLPPSNTPKVAPLQEFALHAKAETKPPPSSSSLRSVRVKPERQKDKQQAVAAVSEKLDSSGVQNNNNNNNNDAKSDAADDEPLSEIVKSAVAARAEETVPEKDAEPLTSAVAPVAQNLNPEKSHSSTIDGGKEDAAPVVQTGDAPAKGHSPEAVETLYSKMATSRSPEVVEVPYKPKTPEIIDLEADTYTPATPLHQPFLHEVKKRKLDILKEGGLEVTPVRGFKEVRPTVIQQAGAQIVPKPIRSDMPPPPHVPHKRAQLSVPHSPNKADQYAYANGNNLPPKVVQSKSIYSYSEKTVYGNPKDYMPPTHHVHTPRFVDVRRGGDILDLTVTSPQKPVVEIMKVPSSVPSYNPNKYRPTPAPPILDGRRLGSNLEITLVGTNKHPTNAQSPKYCLPPPSINRYNQKRISTDHYGNHKVPRMEVNGKVAQQPMATVPALPIRESKSGMEISIPHPYSHRNHHSPMKAQHQMAPPASNPKHVPPQSPAPFSYLPHLYEGNKNPYMPLVDPIYYTAAMQGLYPHTPIPSFPSTEQLKFYSDLMAHSSRLNFPFPIGPDANPSIVNNNSLKKP